MSGLRTWNNGKRCAMCCNGDRCEDSRCLDRKTCPHCHATGWSLWTEDGREDYAKYLQGWRGMSADEAAAELARLGHSLTPPQAPQHVLKAEAATSDATDRGVPVISSPDGGPMGAGQPAAAGPAEGHAA
jgi:hypothetical protein